MSNFSEIQKIEARNVDIIDFLRRTSKYDFKKSGNGYRCIEHDSLFVNADRRRWYWNSQQLKGSNAIDFCEQVYNMSFPAAMSMILGENGEISNLNNTNIPAQKIEKEAKNLNLPAKTAGKFNRVYAYLNQSRCIDSQIISQLMHENKIYQDEKNNAVFVGFDKDNNAKFACVRGTLTEKTFRGDCLGSDKRFSFSTAGTVPEKLYVFESPIELMSHATLANKVTGNPDAWKRHNRLSLAGTSDVALSQYLEDNPNIKEIIFCLNNDSAGETATAAHIEKFTKMGYSCRNMPPKNNDYNDDLKVHIGRISGNSQVNQSHSHIKRSFQK